MTNEKSEGRWERTVSRGDAGVRLDKFWGRELAGEGVSRGRIKGWIESGLALVDGEAALKGNRKLMPDQTVAIRAAGPEPGECAAEPVRGDIRAVFEDERMLVVVKPAGLTTHPAPGEPGPTLVNLLVHQWPDIAAENSSMDPQRPGIVHRLDKDTSGLMAVARTEPARLALSASFAERRTFKVYLALVHGCPEPAEGTIDAPLGRHPHHKTRMAVLPRGGREARSDYRVLWTGPRGPASLVAVRIHTGRTHQIRVHMAHIGHLLLGDAAYGPRENREWARRPDRLAGLAPRQMLHAFYLSVPHPATGEPVTRWLAPPEDFRALMAGLARECLRVGIVGMPGGGKSALLKALRGMGRPCFSADECVAGLYGPGGDGAAMIEQRFGGQYTLDDGGVDKPGLFAAMRGSGAVRREVMDMVHPMVRHQCEAFFRAHRDEPVAYAEIPLLLEGGWHKSGPVDPVAGVRCPAAKRTGELRKLRGLSPEILAVFDSWQWPEADKLAACDPIVDNDKGLAELAEGARGLDRAATAAGERRNREFEDWMDGLWPKLAGELDAERVAGRGRGVIPIRDNVPRETRPYAVLSIIAVNAPVFLFVFSMPPEARTRIYYLFGVVPARFFEPDWAARAGFPDTLGWPFLTYMFLHGGWLHVILNMWMLWIFGDNIEDVTGHGWFVLFYVLCGPAAVATHMAFERASPMPVIGASGAIAGVMGAYIVLYPQGRVLTLIPIFFFPFFFRIPASLFLGFWFLMQILSGVYSTAHGAQNVARWAHVGGFVAGIVLIRWFRRPGRCRYCYNPDTRDYDPEDAGPPPAV